MVCMFGLLLIGPLIWCGLQCMSYTINGSSSIECGLHGVWSVSNGPLVSYGLYDLHNQMVLFYHVVWTMYNRSTSSNDPLVP